MASKHLLLHALLLLAIGLPAVSWGRTPLTQASAALLGTPGVLRFTVYGETDLAPARVHRDASRTYIELAADPHQKVEVMEVTPIGYRRLPSTYESPYLVVSGFAPSLAISYPGRKLVFLEFGAETVRKPASEAELQIRLRERASALLAQQTRLDSEERALVGKARSERLAAESAAKDAAAQQQSAQIQLAKLAKEREALETLAKQPPAKTFDIHKTDGSLKGVLSRWIANEGMQFEWAAGEAANAEVAVSGKVAATDIREAITKLLLAFRSKGVPLIATFYNNNVVEISAAPAK